MANPGKSRLETERPAAEGGVNIALPGGDLGKHLTLMAVGLVAWILMYRELAGLSQWITYDVFGLAEGAALGSSVQFFTYDAPKVLMLLTLVVFGVGIMRTFFTPERTRAILAGRREVAGNFMGVLTAGVPLGVTFSFLIAAPLVNEVALVLLLGLFGWKVAALYLVTGLSVAILSGIIIGRLGLERWVEPWVYEMQTGEAGIQKMGWTERIEAGWEAVKDIVGRVWPYMLVGIAVGAAIHGYVPQDAMASIMGREAWWSVPAAVILGIPLYTNAAGMIPIVAVAYSHLRAHETDSYLVC